jgi:hypothetical protein
LLPAALVGAGGVACIILSILRSLLLFCYKNTWHMNPLIASLLANNEDNGVKGVNERLFPRLSMMATTTNRERLRNRGKVSQ